MKDFYQFIASRNGEEITRLLVNALHVDFSNEVLHTYFLGMGPGTDLN